MTEFESYRTNRAMGRRAGFPIFGEFLGWWAKRLTSFTVPTIIGRVCLPLPANCVDGHSGNLSGNATANWLCFLCRLIIDQA